MSARAHWIVSALGWLTLIPLLPQPAAAQPRASERATVRQMVNGTALTVDFSRPVARGRTNLFGGVVHFGELWTPGANYATTLAVDRPVTLDGHRVGPGTYSVWLEPRAQGPWRISLHERPDLYHDSPVPPDGFVARWEVAPGEAGHMEALNWYVHALTPTGATLRMHWGSTFVPITVETEPYGWDQPPARVRASYLGAFAFDTRDPTTGGPMALTIEVLEEDGALVGRWAGTPVALVPAGEPGSYHIGFLRNGALFDVPEEMTLRVRTADGVSTGADLLWEGEVFGEGRKVR